MAAAVVISIHTPRKGERPCLHRFRYIRPCYFNPHSPQGGATIQYHNFFIPVRISIHTPRKGERPHGCRKPSRIS